MESELSEWRKGDGSVCGGGAVTYEHDLLNKPINVLGEVKPPPVRCIDVDAAVVNIGDSHK